jgi:V8-like Glu-specific endopeptidase
MKKQRNNSTCAFALQIAVSVTLICISLILFALISGAGPANSRSQGVVMNQGELTSFTDQGNRNDPDFVNMRPMPLPLAAEPIDMVPSLEDLGTPGFSAGAVGNGQTSPITLPLPTISDEEGDMEGPYAPDEFGTAHQPFSTARADLLTLATNTQYPYRASGQLTFQKPNDNTTYYCSASMIKRGLVVTAAHCVANYGQQQYYHNWHFYPGRRSGVAPYGDWTVYQVWIKTAYYNGTDNCAQYGVVCPDDVAVLILNTQGGVYVGSRTGWYGYGWGGFGFYNGLTHITQIGYPLCLDHGTLMERNDSQGSVSASDSSNTIIGSLMCGGSSGGPWLNNFGVRPTLTGTGNGTASNPNLVVGVTSWGSITPAVKHQGASPFTNNNIVSLVTSACNSRPLACQ